MKGSPEVIVALNECLRHFHTAFVVFGTNLSVAKKYGYEETSKTFKSFYKENMETCEKLINRIVFLDGNPFFDGVSNIIEVSETVEEMLSVGNELMLKGIANLSSCIEISTQFKDFGTRNLVENMLVEEEKHLAHIEAKMIQLSERVN